MFLTRIIRAHEAEYPIGFIGVQRISPRAIGGRCSAFWASVPNFNKAGPSIQIPNDDRGLLALIRCISLSRTISSLRDNPAPPYSFGQVGTVQPLETIRSSQIFCASDSKTKLRPPQQASSKDFISLRISAGQFSSNQALASMRNASKSLIRSLKF